MAASTGIIFAIIAAFSFGLWTIFHNRAAPHIDNLFGAIIVSLTAVVLGVLFLIPKIGSKKLLITPIGVLFVVLAGVTALALDFFVLKAYGTGLAISVGGPIIIGGSIAIASVVGFFLGESITLIKLFGIILVIAGSGVLSIFSA